MTSYIFGKFIGGYTQYPVDSQSNVFQQVIANAKAETQVVIHRDGNLMYYCYLRKFEVDKCIGFCVLLNGTYVENVFQAFHVFEELITKIANLDYDLDSMKLDRLKLIIKSSFDKMKSRNVCFFRSILYFGGRRRLFLLRRSSYFSLIDKEER